MNSSGIWKPSWGPFQKVALWPLARIAHMFEPPWRPSAPIRGSRRAVAAAPPPPPFAAFVSGSGSDRAKARERVNAARSCLRVLPGCDGKSPDERGIVTTCPFARSGSRRLKSLAPSPRSARTLSSSSPSSLGTVRARYTPIAAESSGVQLAGVSPTAGNSPGSLLGSLRVSAIHALMPSVMLWNRARSGGGSRASWASSSRLV